MMKLKPILIVIGLFIPLTIISLLIITNHNDFIFNRNLNNNSSTILNTTIYPIPLVTVEPNSSLTYPSNDFVINHINWSSYPNLATGYIYTVYIAGSNDIISHKFIEVQICTEVKDTEDRIIIEEQLAGVAREAKKIYGPNGSINIIGTKGGVARWFASILPYDETVH